MRITNPNQTIQELKDAGYDVKVNHYRDVLRPQHLSCAAGGVVTGDATIVGVLRPGMDLPVYGTAYCHPNDQFNRRIGLTIALGRLMKALGEPS